MSSFDFRPPVPPPIDRGPESTLQARDPRKKTYLFGLLVHGNGTFTVDCIVRNISAGGAKITLAQRNPLPGNIYLIVVKYGLACRSEIAWLSFPARGLKFADMHFVAQNLPQELMFLRQLWLEHCPRTGGIPVVEPWDAARRLALSGSAF
jgi:hypothetical protein